MKLFERPIAELIVFNVADVITTSTTCADDCDDDEEPVMGLGNCA